MLNLASELTLNAPALRIYGGVPETRADEQSERLPVTF